MFRKLKKLFSAQYNHFRPSIHNIVKYPCKKDICQKYFFTLGKLKNNIFPPSTTISAPVYTTLWNTLVKKIFTKTNFFYDGEIKTKYCSPSITISALVYITSRNTLVKNILYFKKKLPLLYSLPAAYSSRVAVHFLENFLLETGLHHNLFIPYETSFIIDFIFSGCG